MHEAALAASIMRIVETTAREQGAVRVRELRLEIGALANVEVEALRFALRAALVDSIAAAAQLECLVVAAEGRCARCGAVVALTTLYDLCPHCEGYPVVPSSGLELRVKDVLLEFAPSAPAAASGVAPTIAGQ